MSDSVKILAAFAAGAAVGAVLGILYAPDKGIETRKKISEQSKKISETMKEKLRFGKQKFDALKDEIGQSNKERAEEYA